jgi:excisionase family DNA binding protein
LVEALKETAAGNAVSLVAVESEVTTREAAALLNVSRPSLIGMIDKGLLPARMVGNQRRLPLEEVLAYKAANRAERRVAPIFPARDSNERAASWRPSLEASF